MSALLGLSALPSIVLVIVLSATASVVPFVLIRRLFPGQPAADTQALAQTTASRIGVMHGLVLALALTYVTEEHNELAENIDREAIAIEELFRALYIRGGPRAEQMRSDVLAYTETVVDLEWSSLAQGRPSRAASELINAIHGQAVQMELEQLEDEGYTQHLVALVSRIEVMRGQRLLAVHQPPLAVVWAIGVIGFVFVLGTLYVHRVTLGHCLLIGMYGALIGLVLYGIVAFSNPFRGGAALAPTAFESVFARETGVARPGAPDAP